MASEKAGQRQASSFKCRRCREFLFSGCSVLPSVNPEDGVRRGNHGNTSLHPPSNCPFGIRRALWYISDDARPPWIQSAIEKAQWTRGKLACPKCRGRLGSFDFLTPSIRHSQDRQQAWTCVQIIASRVDHETHRPTLASLIRANRLWVKGQTDLPDSSLKADYAMSADSHSLGDSGDGALPKICWSLSRDELDSVQLLNIHADPSTNLVLGEPKNTQTRNHFGSDQRECLTVTTEKSLQNSEFKTRSDINVPNTCEVTEPSVPADWSSLRTKEGKDYASTSQNPPGCSHARHEVSLRNTGRSENGPTHVNSVDELIQFGFATARRDESTRNYEDTQHLFTDACGRNNSENQTVFGGTVTSNLALPSQSMQVQPSLYHSVSSNSQDLHSAPIQIQDCQHSNEDSQSEESLSILRGSLVDGTTSPEQWQGFLDELLLELDRERRGALMSTWRGHSNINQLENEMDADSQQNGGTDEARISQDENIDDDHGMSAYLQRAVLRAQRSERNRRKSERRKLRRREQWREKKEVEEHELHEEELNLDCDPQKILTLLGTHQSGVSIREALTCPVCLDLYLNPHHCLPCRHVFCEPCLRRLANTRQTSVTTPCPLCRTIIRDTRSQDELTAAIEELFPRLIGHRRQAERKTLNKSYPLPGQTAPPSLTSWINRTLAGRSRHGLYHARWRGRQERATVGLIANMAWKFGAVVVLMAGLTGLSGALIFIMMNYS